MPTSLECTLRGPIPAWGVILGVLAVVTVASATGVAPAGPAAPSVVAAPSLFPPNVGDGQLEILSPTVLDLTLVSSCGAGEEPQDWNFVNGGVFAAPDAKDLEVTVGTAPRQVRRLGFKRRVLFAPDRTHDLRLMN